MRMRAGFSLIELLIATFVAALLSGLLFTGYWQVQKSMQRFDIYTQRHASLELIERILSRDLMGAFVPLTVLQKDAQKKDKKKDSEEQPEKQQKVPPIKGVFKVNGSDELTTSCTFITNNLLSGYAIEGISIPKPWILRVSYKLEKEKDGTYKLMRQESHDLAIDSSQPWYQIADGIQTFAMTLIRYQQGDDDTAEMKQVESNDWNSDDPEVCPTGPCYVPDCVIVKLSFAKRGQPSARSYQITVPIIAYAIFTKATQVQEPQKQDQKKQSPQKTDQENKGKVPTLEDITKKNRGDDTNKSDKPVQKQQEMTHMNSFESINIVTFVPKDQADSTVVMQRSQYAPS